VTGVKNFRHNLAQLANVSFVAEPNDYRGVFGPGAQPYLDEIDRTIGYTTSGALAGMIVETVQGYGGIVLMPDGYLKGAAERVRAAGGLLILDEVQAGFGKTGTALWGFEQHGVVPDIVVLGKGIGNGMPLGAVVARRAVAEAMAGKFIFHTYRANPVSCAAGRAVLRVIRDDRLVEYARTVGAALKTELQRLQQRHPVIGDVRGQGFMLAMELVEDRQTKTPAPEATAAVFEATRQNGIVLSKSGNFRNILRIVPPLCLSMDDVAPVAAALDRSFAEALA
jgi:alanine-glyoxylate transaminase / (R)-3-amino-2-methylpropionate-pyruvate transaminase